MKLVYIILTTVVVLFGGKCAFAKSDPGSVMTLSNVKSALWNDGVNELRSIEKSLKTKASAKKIMPEELKRAMELERKRLYNL